MECETGLLAMQRAESHGKNTTVNTRDSLCRAPGDSKRAYAIGSSSHGVLDAMVTIQGDDADRALGWS